MNTDFWLTRWTRNEIGFHQRSVNEYLVKYWSMLGVGADVPAFVPLCGKSLDMRWLREQAGHSVLGVEIARTACREFFSEWNVEPQVTRERKFETFSAQGVKILCGDFFDLQASDLAGIGAVFDRAALIALPTNMRARYATHLRAILPPKTPMLLVAPDYAQQEMSGPPFAVGETEIHALFAGCEVDMLAEIDVTSSPDNARFRQRGVSRLVERVFRIT